MEFPGIQLQAAALCAPDKLIAGRMRKRASTHKEILISALDTDHAAIVHVRTRRRELSGGEVRRTGLAIAGTTGLTRAEVEATNKAPPGLRD